MTICSNEKDHTANKLPAYLRYKSARIDNVRDIAKNKGLPFFILSGEYGLVAENDTVPYYDHLLVQDEVDGMTALVSSQNKALKITSIEFYAKSKKGSWVPYYSVVERMTKEQGISLKIVEAGL